MSATSKTKADPMEAQTGVAVQTAGNQPSLVEHESPVPATLGKKGEMTRQQILSAALNLFRERGFDAATMRDIAESAGMSLGLLSPWAATHRICARVTRSSCSMRRRTAIRACSMIPSASM